MYRIYLGENNTTDFNVVRNRVYNIDARILGLNTVDWRVSTAELTVTPFAENSCTGASCDNRNCGLHPRTTPKMSITCPVISTPGRGIVAIDGVATERPACLIRCSTGQRHGVRLASAYTASRVSGDVRLRLTVTDKHGFSMERVLTTVFKKPELTITYAQQGNELTV